MPKKLKPSPSRQNLGQAQLEVLQYVADHQPIRVSDVAEHFAATQGKARTTILTVMEKLREKGYLSRKKRKGAYHYSAVAAKSRIMTNVVRSFVDGSLGGSISPFIAYLSESRGLSEDEVKQLEELVKEVDPSPSKPKRKRGSRSD